VTSKKSPVGEPLPELELMTSVIRMLADAELDIATNAVVINKDESDFMKRLLEGG
jgi:hypothetical protein